MMSNFAAVRNIRIYQLLLLGVPLLFVAVITLPFLWLIANSFVSEGSLSFAHYQRIIDNTSYHRVYRDTFNLSFVVTFFVILIGYPVAYCINNVRSRTALIILACVAIPFWTSLLVRTYAWMLILQRHGVLNTFLIDIGLIDQPLPIANGFLATTIGMVHVMLPFFIFPVYSVMRQIDPRLNMAAAASGASPTRSFFNIFLPLTMPGVVAGTILVFVLCLGFYVTPQFLGGGNVVTVAMQVERNIANYFDWGAASALGVTLILAVALVGLAALAILKIAGVRK